MKLPAAWLCCLLLTSPAWAADTVVTGKVYLERDGKPGRGATDPGLAGVQVSNGETIVKTAADGSYSLPVRDGQTVFVIKPDAYAFPKAADGLPSFWRHYRPNGSPALKYGGIAATSDVTRNWDFALQSDRHDSRRGFQMLVFTDSQTASLKDIGYYQQSIVAPLVGQTRARMGTTLGDIVNDDLTLYPAINKVTTELGVPWFHVPGNHDLDFDAASDEHSLDSWRNIYGPDTYAVEEGGASFVFLDDVVYDPKARPKYIGGLREDQFAFLASYLKGLHKDRLLVLGMHIPLFDAAPGRETFRHADRQRLFDLLKDFRNVLVLSGHSHTQQHVYHGKADGWNGDKPLHEYNVGANCGAFWSGVKNAAGVPDSTMSDGTPKGYALLDVAGNGSYACSTAWPASRPASRSACMRRRCCARGLPGVGHLCQRLHGRGCQRGRVPRRWWRLAADEAGQPARSAPDGGERGRRSGRQPAWLRPLAGGHRIAAPVAWRAADRSGGGQPQGRGTLHPARWRSVHRHHQLQPADCPALTPRTSAPAKGPRMDIRFMAGTTPVTLSRHWFTGAMLLQSATEKVWVQHPLHPGTHFSFSLVQSWLRHIAGHEVLVERTRPLLFAGFRPQRLRVLVDGVQVAEQEGM
jgi:hypothetical protein